jgi:nucleotide-binding universal stress UspA family protein
VANAAIVGVPQDPRRMPVNVIVSYDGTVNDDDALALAKILAEAGATLSLAYVRHSREYDPRREELAAHDAEQRLEMGATWLDQPDIPRHVVINPSTGDGLAELAAAEHASMVVFGSDYRTSPGGVEPGQAAQHMLTGGTVPIAVAVAGLRADRDHAIRKIAVSGGNGGDAAQRTAASLADALEASLTTAGDHDADLIVVGSQAGARDGHIALSGASRTQLDSARTSVLVLPHGSAVAF